jgi:multidrug resistance efflux pump
MNIRFKSFEQMTDSREMLEAQAHPCILFFIYMGGLFVVIAGLWSYFAEIEDIVKAEGIVELNQQVVTVRNNIAGQVEHMYYSQNQEVSQGELLLRFNQQDLEVELETLRADYHNMYTELEALTQLIANPRSLHRQEGECNSSYFRNVEFRLQANHQAGEYVQETLRRLHLLGSSTSQEGNPIFEGNHEYLYKYQDYVLKKKKFQHHITLIEQDLHAALTTYTPVEEFNRMKQQREEAILDLETFTNGFELHLQQEISSETMKMKQILFDREQVFAEIQAWIREREPRLHDIHHRIQHVGQQQLNRELRASTAGTVHVLRETHVGDLLSVGEELITIVPAHQEEYEVSLSITSHQDYRRISLGKTVQFQFVAVPHLKYRQATGTIISKQRGVLKARLLVTPDDQWEGMEISLQQGMVTQARIHIGNTRIWHYVLAKMNLREP